MLGTSPLGTLCHTVQGPGQVICPFYALPLRDAPYEAPLWGWRWEDKYWKTITLRDNPGVLFNPEKGALPSAR